MTLVPPAASVEQAERTLALAGIYRAQRAIVRQQLRGFGVRDSALEDAVHDVFVIAFRRLADYDGARGSLRAWLVGIAWRVAATHRRRRDDRGAPLDDEIASDLPDPEAYVARSQAAVVLDRLLRTLPSEQAAALVLAELEGLSGHEIAEQWQIAPATAYTRVARARLELKAELERQRYGRRAWWAALMWPGRDVPGSVALAAFASMRVLVGIVLALVVLGGVSWWLAEDAAPPDVHAADTPTYAADPRVRGDRPARRPDDVSFGRGAASASLSGRVHTVAGTPIAGAEVCIWPEISEHAGVVPTCTETTANGSYRIAELPPSRYRVTASARGYAPGEATTTGSHGASSIALHASEQVRGVDIVLVDGGIELRGVVTDVFGGPVEGARVTVRERFDAGHVGVPSWGPGVPVHALTGTDGTFAVWVAPGQLDLGAHAEGYADADVQASAPGPTVAIALLPESTLSGIVVDRATRAPVAGARIVLRAWSETAQSERTVGFSDEAGRFAIGGLVAGRYRPAALADGLHGESDRSHVLELGESVDDVVIEMIPAASLRANVVVAPDDTPCPSGSVMLWDRGGDVVRTASIAPDGVASFEALTAGDYNVVVACDEHDSADVPRSVDVGGSAPAEVTWRVARGHAIHGHVRDAAGEPLAGHVVASASSEGPDGSYRWTRIAADGGYTIAGLAPGDYSVTAVTEAPSIVGRATIARGDVALDLVATATVRVAGRVIRGREGAPAVEVRVRLGGGHIVQTALTRDDGSFAFEALAPGKHTFVARDELGNHSVERSLTVVADHPPAELVLALPEPRSIRGIVLDEDGAPLRDALVSARASDALTNEATRRSELRAAKAGRRGTTLTDAQGEFVLEGVADDRTYTVVAERRGGGSASKSGVRAGEHARLQLAATATIRGTVRAETGPTALWIEVYADDGLVHRESFVLGSGEFEIADLDAGAYQVRAIAREGRGRVPALARAGETTSVEIALVPYRTIRGRFVDLEDGAPLPGLWATVAEEGESPLRIAIEAERAIQSRAPGQLSDADGNFVVQRVPPTTALLLVLSAGLQFDAPDHVHDALLVPQTIPPSQILEIPIARPRLPPSAPMPDLGFTLDAIPLGCGETIGIAEVHDPSLAELRKGDDIVAIDGHDVSGHRCYLVKTLLSLRPGERAELTLARGTKVSVTSLDPDRAR